MIKSGAKKILVVDDDVSTLEILLLIIRNAGYEVEVAKDHNHPLLLSSPYPDLIILDNNLGSKTGAEICQELKSKTESRHIPVIMISAMDDIKKIATDACADDFIAKPFGIQQMLDKISRILGT